MNSIAKIMFRLYARLSVAGIAVCVLLMGLTFALNKQLGDVLTKTITAQRAIALSRAIREQYIHELHGLVYTTSSHMHHHEGWVHDAAEQIRELEVRSPRSVVWRAVRAGRLSDELNSLFEDQLLPAALRGDTEKVAKLHAEAHALSETAVSHADALAEFLGAEAEASYQTTLWVARAGFAMMLLGGILVLAMFIGARRRLAARVLRPLESFVQDVRIMALAAKDTDPRELAELRTALQRLNEAFVSRRLELVREERLAVLGKLCGRIAEVIETDLQHISDSVAQLQRVNRSIPADEMNILAEEVATCTRLADDLSTWRRRPSLQLERRQISSFLNEVLQRTIESDYVIDVVDCELVLDPVRVRQIVRNLIHNASQAASSEPITIRGRVVGEHYRLEIADRGPGLPSDMLERVFEPFFTTRSGGAGLGLAISRELARAHGGDLRFDNAPGGAVVTLTLPVG